MKRDPTSRTYPSKNYTIRPVPCKGLIIKGIFMKSVDFYKFFSPLRCRYGALEEQPGGAVFQLCRLLIVPLCNGGPGGLNLHNKLTELADGSKAPLSIRNIRRFLANLANTARNGCSKGDTPE